MPKFHTQIPSGDESDADSSLDSNENSALLEKVQIPTNNDSAANVKETSSRWAWAGRWPGKQKSKENIINADSTPSSFDDKDSPCDVTELKSRTPVSYFRGGGRNSFCIIYKKFKISFFSSKTFFRSNFFDRICFIN